MSVHFMKWENSLENKLDTTPKQFTNTSYGLATMITLGCLKCVEDANNDTRKRKGTITVEPTKREQDKHSTGSDLCQYDINIRFCLALQLMGIGGEQAQILTSFLDLPEAHKWPRNFRCCRSFYTQPLKL